jgi:hypothetical protein
MWEALNFNYGGIQPFVCPTWWQPEPELTFGAMWQPEVEELANVLEGVDEKLTVSDDLNKAVPFPGSLEIYDGSECRTSPCQSASQIKDIIADLSSLEEKLCGWLYGDGIRMELGDMQDVAKGVEFISLSEAVIEGLEMTSVECPAEKVLSEHGSFTTGGMASIAEKSAERLQLFRMLLKSVSKLKTKTYESTCCGVNVISL